MDFNRYFPTLRLLRKNFLAAKASAFLLIAAILFGTISCLLWGRAHWEEGALLLALLLLASFDLGNSSVLTSQPSRCSHVLSWLILLCAFLGLLFSWQTHAVPFSNQDFSSLLCKHGALLFLAFAISLRFDGTRTAFIFLPRLLLGFVLLPLYEVIILEISYPLRLLSTSVTVLVLRLCTVQVISDGTTLLWGTQVISITDACSGISFLSFLALLEYLIVRPIDTAAWKKWCWSSLLLFWIILGNALRLLLTFALYAVMGDAVFERIPHFLLGCFFIIVTSLLIWFSSFVLPKDIHPQEQP